VNAPAAEAARLRRRGFRLEYATVAWMVAEAGVAVTAGLAAASVALVGFGLDSVIELASAGIVIWQLRGEISGQDRQTRAVRLIGVTFFALAAYLTAQALRDLATAARPGQSVPGLAVTAAALVVMPVLAAAKRRTGQALGNRTLVADSAETAFCAFTSAAALLGVGLNAWLGWWWADPAAALVIAALAVNEGIECWESHDEALPGEREGIASGHAAVQGPAWCPTHHRRRLPPAVLRGHISASRRPDPGRLK
jgi:divalent metal cation (Fe/Co/Zn/Cd) transporter